MCEALLFSSGRLHVRLAASSTEAVEKAEATTVDEKGDTKDYCAQVRAESNARLNALKQEFSAQQVVHSTRLHCRVHHERFGSTVCARQDAWAWYLYVTRAHVGTLPTLTHIQSAMYSRATEWTSLNADWRSSERRWTSLMQVQRATNDL